MRSLTLCSAVSLCLLAAACGGGDDTAPQPPAAAPAPPPTAPPAPPPAPAVPEGAVPNELVIRLLDAADLPAILAQYQLTLIDQFGRRPIYRLRASVVDTQPLADQLRTDARVVLAEPNYFHQAPESRKRSAWAIGGDAGVWATQWNSRALRLPEAHSLATGAGITVAVLDTGLDPDHPVFSGRLALGFDFVDFDADSREGGAPGDWGYGHGTHVASLVAQVAPGARIMPLRVLDAQGLGNIWVLSDALLHAVDPDRNPNTNDGAQVINLSLGTMRRTDLLEDILERVTCGDDYDDDDDDADDDVVRCAAGGTAVVISAAGNSGDGTVHYPAAERHNGALAVAANTERGELASFSTRGDWVQVSAPGELIYGAIPGGAYAVWNGTSMAAPMVAGAAALLRQRHPQWQPSDITNQLRSTGIALCGSNLNQKQIDPAAALGGTSGAGFACR